MQFQREIRFHASIPKLLLFLLGSLAFVAIGWWIWTTQHSQKSAIVGVLALGFFGLCALVFLGVIVAVAIFRKPLLQIDELGFTEFPMLAPWRHYSVPWANVAGIGIQVQRFRRGFFTQSIYYLVVQARHPELLPNRTKKTYQWTVAMYPSLAHAALAESLQMMFLVTTKRRRARMLERIKTTFTTELLQHNIWVDEEERPL